MSSSKLFNALCWVSQTTFPEDLEKGLISVGASAEVASDIRFAFQASSSRQIMSFYEEYAYAGNNPEWEKYLSAFLHKRIAEYQPKKKSIAHLISRCSMEIAHEDQQLLFNCCGDTRASLRSSSVRK